MMVRLGIYLLFGIAASHSYAISDDTPAVPTALRIGENRVTFSQRYDEWLQTIPGKERAWSLLNSVSDDAENLEHPSTELVERLHAILEYPVLGMPTDELGVSPDDDPEDTELLLGLLLPHIGLLRVNSELLVADCEAVDRPDRLLKNLRSLQQIQQYTSITDTLIEAIVLIKLDTQMFSMVLNDALDLEAWNQASLDELAFIFAIPSAWEPAHRFIQSERALQTNFLDWIYINSDENQLSSKGATRLLSITEQDEPREMMIQVITESVRPRAEQEQKFQQIAQAAQADLSIPLHNTPSLLTTAAEESLAQLSNQTGLGFLPVGLITPAYGEYITHVYEGRAYRDAARLKIAAYQHRARKGTLPESTAAIDDDLLDQIPIDPYTGDPLRLRIEEGRVVIYSIGPDRDDDQGRELQDHRFMLSNEYNSLSEDEKTRWDGDWVLTDTP